MGRIRRSRHALPAALARQALHTFGWEEEATGGRPWERGHTTWSHEGHPRGKVHVYPDGSWYHVRHGGRIGRVLAHCCPAVGKGTGYQSIREYLSKLHRS